MKRIITLIGVVLIGVIIGVAVVTQQAKDPILQEILKQQDSILSSQKRLESKIFPPEGPVFLDKRGNTIDDNSSAVNNVQLKALETRVTKLEQQINGLEKILSPIIKQLNRPKPPAEDFTKVYNLDINSSPIRGHKDAPVTIVEFTDFQCPYCSRFHKEILKVIKAFPTQVKYVIKNFPLSFHPYAKPAAKAALAANEQGKFFEMADEILMNNRNLGNEQFHSIAKKIGLNIKKFDKDLKDKEQEWNNIIKRDINLGRKSNVRGTPTFFINGRKTRARSFDQFKQEINKILKEKQ